MIAIIDYGAGNLRSVQKACEYNGADATITSDKNIIETASRVILPGVGAFGDCMSAIEKLSLSDTIKKVCDKGTPFLGICLGLQLLFESSEETPNSKGLGIFKGNNAKIPKKDGFKIPHMGWNSLNITKSSPIFRDIDNGDFVYFVHSYYMCPQDKSIISATCEYTEVLPVALCSGNVNAVQFHPEKSGETGLKILKNFIDFGGDI